MEDLLAFFMESVFLGLWIFGWDTLSPRLHLATIWLAAIGTNCRPCSSSPPIPGCSTRWATGSARSPIARSCWALAFTAGTIVAAVARLFGDLRPNVLPSSTAAAYSLTVTDASSAHYTPMVMTRVALIFTPAVLAYQGWTYRVFRKRLSNSDIGPADAIGAAAPPPRFAAGQP